MRYFKSNRYPMGDIMLNRNNPVPLYYQLATIIREKINTKLNPHDQLPTETELIKKYNVSRDTVRRAIGQLINEGYVFKNKRKGFYVKEPTINFLGDLKGFSEEMEEKGIEFYSKTLKKGTIKANYDIAQKLEIKIGDPVFSLSRLRFILNRPMIITTSYIPSEKCPGIENNNFEKESLYKVLKQKYGIFIKHGQRIFMPIEPNGRDIELLNINKKTALLYIQSIVYMENNIPIEYIEAKIKGKFTVNLIRQEEIGKRV